MRANKLFDLWPNFFYRNKVVVYIEKPNKIIEKHYFNVDKDIILINSFGKKGYERNPKIISRGFVFESGTKAPIYLMKEGDTVIKSFSDYSDSQSKPITSLYGQRLIELGRMIENSQNPYENKDGFEQFILPALGFVFVGQIICIFMLYSLAEHLEFSFF